MCRKVAYGIISFVLVATFLVSLENAAGGSGSVSEQTLGRVIESGDVWVYSDPVGDERTVLVEDNHDESVDLTKFKVWGDSSYLHFEATFADITTEYGKGAPWVCVTFDTENHTGGMDWYPEMIDAKVGSSARWEKTVYTRFGYGANTVGIYNTDWERIETSKDTATISAENDTLRFRVGWERIYPEGVDALPENIRMTVVTAKASKNNIPQKCRGASILDLITDKENTSAEFRDIQFPYVDYYLDFKFGSDGSFISCSGYSEEPPALPGERELPENAYYSYWSSDQIHRSWIDMDNDDVMDPYENTSLSTEKRVDDLVSRLSLEEKCDQLNTEAPEIDRLGIPSYNWGQEALHGVGVFQDGTATVFPQNVNQAQSFDKDLISKVYAAVGEEARAKFHCEDASGLNFFSPAVLGIMQDKRWQRFQESLGESPYLTSRLAVETFRAFQGENDGFPYRRAVATAKHFVANRGPFGRDHPYATKSGPASMRKTREVAFAPYRAAVKEGNVKELMAAFSGYRPTGLDPFGVPCSYSRWLLTEVLRNEWGFTGHVTSDWGSISSSMDTFEAPSITKSRSGAAATALKAGLNVNLGDIYGSGAVENAIDQGFIKENYVTRATRRLFRSRFNLGLFDPPSMVPYSDVSENVISCEEHVDLALKSAREAIVLLKNQGVLPLDENIDSVGVIGPVADDVHFGGYSGTPPFSITPIEGIENHVSAGTAVNTAFTTSASAVKRVAENSDVAIVFIGPTPGHEMVTQENLQQPFEHLKMLKTAVRTGTPTVAVMIAGNPFASNFMKEETEAVVQAGYLGMMQGRAIADVIFGDYNPGGSLSYTIPRPGRPTVYYYPKAGEFDYNENTYLWPFGYGLSYTSFEYENLSITPKSVSTSGNVQVSVDVKNVGSREGDEVVQLYLRDENATVKTFVRKLEGFERVSLNPGEMKNVKFTLTSQQLSLLNENLKRVVQPGEFKVMIGSYSENIALKGSFEITESPERGAEEEENELPLVPFVAGLTVAVAVVLGLLYMIRVK